MPDSWVADQPVRKGSVVADRVCHVWSAEIFQDPPELFTDHGLIAVVDRPEEPGVRDVCLATRTTFQPAPHDMVGNQRRRHVRIFPVDEGSPVDVVPLFCHRIATPLDPFLTGFQMCESEQ
ncbi:hypothetical protein [Streptomyces sp. CAU 1734]|uniref:hypothetical protein n=1 Tax=Streptomyces sp. CAU 1734 TaxID=3140360 RepID=UPI00325FE3CF